VQGLPIGGGVTRAVQHLVQAEQAARA
jgi:hypothetical protein